MIENEINSTKYIAVKNEIGYCSECGKKLHDIKSILCDKCREELNDLYF
jgi:predicted amidophosphoribosyltransferase